MEKMNKAYLVFCNSKIKTKRPSSLEPGLFAFIYRHRSRKSRYARFTLQGGAACNKVVRSTLYCSTAPLPLLGFLRQAQDKLLALQNGRKQKDLTPLESGLLI
jgi:hypothetical protein